MDQIRAYYGKYPTCISTFKPRTSGLGCTMYTNHWVGMYNAKTSFSVKLHRTFVQINGCMYWMLMGVEGLEEPLNRHIECPKDFFNGVD